MLFAIALTLTVATIVLGYLLSQHHAPHLHVMLNWEAINPDSYDRVGKILLPIAALTGLSAIVCWARVLG